MPCPLCNNWIDKPHCPSPTCPWKWCAKCNVDVSPRGDHMKHNPLPKGLY